MSYAHLGQSCQTSLAVLIDNKKFFSLNDPVYNIVYTRMQRYPATHDELPPISNQVEKPEDIKTAVHKNRYPEEYQNMCGGCGKK